MFINEEEKQELLKAWENGGKAKENAMKRVMNAHESLFKKQARLLVNQGIDKDDAIQLVRLTAWEKLQAWDIKKGSYWGHYFTTQLRPGAFYNDAQRLKQAPIRPPLTRALKKANQVLKEEIKLFEHNNKREASEDDILNMARDLNIDNRQLDGIHAINIQSINVDDIKEDIEEHKDKHNDLIAQELLSKLNEEERNFIVDVFGLEKKKMTNKELCKKYNLDYRTLTEKKAQILFELRIKAKEVEL